jgi:hypothetical protein
MNADFMIFQAIRRGFSLSSPKCLKITSFTVLKTSAFSTIISLLRSASLRAGLRRKEGAVSLWTQHLRASVCARTRPRCHDVLGYSLSPLRGWSFASSNVTTSTFITLDEPGRQNCQKIVHAIA